MISWSYIGAIVAGGVGFRLINLLIAWIKERREQKSKKTAHEKDRPRFRIDTTKVPSTHAAIPTFHVKILSLGSLPLTIHNGTVTIEADHYPENIKSYQIKGREISSSCPIEFEFSLPSKFINPRGVREPHIKAIYKFSYGDNRDTHEEEKTYNHRSGEFE